MRILPLVAASIRLGLLGLLTACAADPADPIGDDAGRGPIGKADAAGTCELPNGDDHCGGKGVGSCWCDELCVEFGDCCHDAGAVCGIDDGTEPADPTGDASECSPVLCEIACAHGFETDDEGCEICACHDPTGDFCGGIAAIQCPQGFVCELMGDFPDAGGQCVPDQPPPPPPAGGSCWDECGGPGSDGSCWCDDLCEGFGDCCDDYVEACVEPPPPPSCDQCGLGQVCVTMVTQLGPQISCEPVAPACTDGVPTCACMGDAVCTGVFDACSESEDGLDCGCPVC